jgi:D-alanyl-D-alanine carboxypeptidase
MANKFGTLMLGLAMVVTPAFAQDDGPPRPELPPITLNAQMTDTQVGAALGPWLADLNRVGVFNGAVLVARNGREIYAAAYGDAALEPRTPLNVDTRFPLASITKQFTHASILQLIEAGRLSPQTTIGDVIPDYPNVAARAATIDQLITHRGGLADFLGPAFRDTPKENFTSNHAYYDFAARLAPDFAPGAREEYCNSCYVVLGEIIERVSGKPYEQYVAENVLARAGMTSAGYFRHDQAPQNTARFIGHPMGPGTEARDVARWHGVSGSAAGNSYASIRDVLAYDNALREGRLVNTAHTAQMVRGEPTEGRSTARFGYAGGGPGVNTVARSNGEWTLIVLTNHEPPAAEAISETVFLLLAGPRPE